jgi:hypothetical protein
MFAILFLEMNFPVPFVDNEAMKDTKVTPPLGNMIHKQRSSLWKDF